MAFCDELKAYITDFIRSGNTYTANGTAEMIKEIIANIKDEVDNIVSEWIVDILAKKF